MAKPKKMKLPKILKPKAKKATIIYIFLLPMFGSTIKSLFQGEYLKFAIKLIGFGLILASAKLIDKGLEAEFEYNNKDITLAPKHKYKLYGYIVLLIALYFIAFFATHLNLITAIVSPILGALGAYLYYGKDPYINKLPKDSGVNYERLIKSLDEATQKINHIEKEKDEIEDIELKSAVNKALDRAKDILKTIEEDPKDINIVRKFMVVYLDGIKDVITQYNDIDKELLDSSYKERLKDLLNDASSRFDKELERLKSNEIFDLDVQIDALKEQLKN